MLSKTFYFQYGKIRTSVSQNLHNLNDSLILAVNVLLLNTGWKIIFQLNRTQWPKLFSCDSTISQGISSLSFPWPQSSLKKYLLDFFFFNQTEQYSCDYGSGRFFILCGLGGIISCGTTHTALVPLDLVKCRMQVCFACWIKSILLKHGF